MRNLHALNRQADALSRRNQHHARFLDTCKVVVQHVISVEPRKWTWAKVRILLVSLVVLVLTIGVTRQVLRDMEQARNVYNKFKRAAAAAAHRSVEVVRLALELGVGKKVVGVVGVGLIIGGRRHRRRRRDRFERTHVEQQLGKSFTEAYVRDHVARSQSGGGAGGTMAVAGYGIKDPTINNNMDGVVAVVEWPAEDYLNTSSADLWIGTRLGGPTVVDISVAAPTGGYVSEIVQSAMARAAEVAAALPHNVRRRNRKGFRGNGRGTVTSSSSTAAAVTPAGEWKPAPMFTIEDKRKMELAIVGEDNDRDGEDESSSTAEDDLLSRNLCEGTRGENKCGGGGGGGGGGAGGGVDVAEESDNTPSSADDVSGDGDGDGDGDGSDDAPKIEILQ
ncbi:hypothetical protein NFJ02_44g112090 [Pycnococcus provasolii]